MEKDQKRDYSNEVKVHNNKTVRIVLVVAGVVSFCLGFLGLFLPILPTTPFLLLSAVCFAKSSTRFYNMLLNNRLFGKYIRDWRNKKCLPMRTKVIAITTLVVTMGTSVVFFIPILEVKVLLLGIALAVSIYILRIPSC